MSRYGKSIIQVVMSQMSFSCLLSYEKLTKKQYIHSLLSEAEKSVLLTHHRTVTLHWLNSFVVITDA